MTSAPPRPAEVLELVGGPCDGLRIDAAAVRLAPSGPLPAFLCPALEGGAHRYDCDGASLDGSTYFYRHRGRVEAIDHDD